MPGKLIPGMRQLDEQAEHPEADQQVGQGRVSQHLQELLEKAHINGLDLRVRCVEREGSGLEIDRASVDLSQELVEVRLEQVDHVHVERLLRRDVGGIFDRADRPFDIAAA